MSASARAGRSPGRSRRLRVGVFEMWPLPLVNVIPGMVIVLIAAALRSFRVRRGSRVPDAVRIRMDGVDVGRCGDAVDIVDVQRTAGAGPEPSQELRSGQDSGACGAKKLSDDAGADSAYPRGRERHWTPCINGVRRSGTNADDCLSLASRDRV
jgi:hypothetical protein